MADTAISAVLSKLGELAVREAKIPPQVGDDILLLRDRLECLQAFVRDADRRRRAGTDGLTHVWVCQTRDVAFDAEDALDDFFNEEVAGPKDQGCRRRWKVVRSHITGLFTEVVVRHGLVGRIRLIKSRLDQISVNQKEYQIVHTPSVVFASSTTAIAAWRENLENAKVFDRDVKILKQMLDRKDECSFSVRNGPRDPMFISIVGESGTGKNTLAKIIRREIRSKMDIIVWYDMEPGSSAEDLLAKVYERASLQCTTDERVPIEPLVDIRRLLAQKRYLLILGGISLKTILNSVRASLPDDDGRGRVMLILDTENEELAWHANTMNRSGINGMHLLTCLDRIRSGELFLWKVLRKGNESSSPPFFWNSLLNRLYQKESWISKQADDEYVRLVYDITRGYPMAIVLLAGLLRFKEKPVEWDAVLQKLNSGSETQDRDKGQGANMCSTKRAMAMVFWTSFEDLPSELKSCFFYFASYPKSLFHHADDIVRMWIAEGFIKQPADGKTMEELGHDYLKELVLRCLVEVEKMKVGNGIELVRVHKSIMRLLQSEAREAGFMQIHDLNDALVPPWVRRLSVQSGNGRRNPSAFANKKFPKLRSFICGIIDKENQHHSHDLDFLCSSKFIRIISVQGLGLRSLPDRIGDMINLRYLRIDSLSLQQLPSSISRLLNLQTLDIRNTNVDVIDLEFWKIKTLRHVLASKLMLPITMPVAVNEHEGGVGDSELQTLHGVRLNISRLWIAGNCPLDKMTSLLSLELEMHSTDEERNGLPAFKAALRNMPLLGHLYLKGDRIPSFVFTDPHPILQSLETMVLHGNVNWNRIVSENNPAACHLLRKNRPNLIQIKLQDTNEVPEIIKELLGTMLVKDD